LLLLLLLMLRRRRLLAWELALEPAFANIRQRRPLPNQKYNNYIFTS
jgi:hypothetical protein